MKICHWVRPSKTAWKEALFPSPPKCQWVFHLSISRDGNQSLLLSTTKQNSAQRAIISVLPTFQRQTLEVFLPPTPKNTHTKTTTNKNKTTTTKQKTGQLAENGLTSHQRCGQERNGPLTSTAVLLLDLPACLRGGTYLLYGVHWNPKKGKHAEALANANSTPEWLGSAYRRAAARFF